jgi:Coenzyme PQQ synthesis protein D (PqqD)
MPVAHYRIKSPPVVLETVDEETIIVNLDTGSYYDLNHTGGRLLAALGRGADLDGAVTHLAADYGVDRGALAEAAATLVGRLEEEGIIAAADADPDADRTVNGWAPPAKPYEAPALSKYTDMQELLLLDPVHEVDGAGWPNKA